MGIKRTAIILALLFAGFSQLDCGGAGKNSNAVSNSEVGTASNNEPRTNQEELRLLINIPYEPLDIVWKQDPLKKKITAVLLFSTEDAAKIVEASEKFGASHPVHIPEQTWFPDELTAQAELSGGDSLNGAAFPGNIFFQDPYNSGEVTRIEGGDYFVLDISSK